jgi:hypothetical protein
VKLLSATMAAEVLSSSFHKRSWKELGQSWVKERGLALEVFAADSSASMRAHGSGSSEGGGVWRWP